MATANNTVTIAQGLLVLSKLIVPRALQLPTIQGALHVYIVHAIV